MLKVGDKAPAFTLFNSEKQEVSLSQFEGKNVVILFFPFAFTSVCTTELCGVRDDISSYNTLNTEVLAISVDSLFTLGAFKEKEQYNFNLLSDFNKHVSKSYATIYDTFAFGTEGVSKRSAFVVNKKGELAYVEVLENAGDVPNITKINEVLKSLN